ncbi:MAG: hypothetical protein ACFB4I_03260 [Cyanophyceae cyanobacterium]
MIATTNTALREDVHQLAERAFKNNLISGYGDGQYQEEYQLVLHGKPRHYSLERAYLILRNLLNSQFN